MSSKMIRNGYKSTDAEFIEVVKSSNSIREVLEKLNLKAAGGNYQCFHKRIKDLNISIDHFTDPKVWNKGKKFGPRRSLEEYLNGVPIQSHKLKLRLIAEGLKQHKCECCGIKEWNNKPAPIELDHINGNHHDNRLENLRLLCPNCHAQTETYRGKNKSSSK
jgi:Zn finger protein HypA/HybF involved in hydrogenase expression